MLQRLFPGRIDNRFDGPRLALWLLAIHVGLKLIISTNSILNTAKVANGADGFQLASYGADGARAVLMLFAAGAMTGLALALLGMLALLRYRAMAPLVMLLLLFEAVGRRLIVESYAIERSSSVNFPFILNASMIALLAIGLGLSLWPSRRATPASGAE